MQARGQPRPRGAAAPGCGQAVPRRATGCRVPAVFLPPRGLAVCRSVLPSSALHCPALQCAVLQLHRPAPFCSALLCVLACRGPWPRARRWLRSALGSPAAVPARALRRARAARFVLNQPEVLLDNAEMSWHKKKIRNSDNSWNFHRCPDCFGPSLSCPWGSTLLSTPCSGWGAAPQPHVLFREQKRPLFLSFLGHGSLAVQLGVVLLREFVSRLRVSLRPMARNHTTSKRISAFLKKVKTLLDLVTCRRWAMKAEGGQGPRFAL